MYYLLEDTDIKKINKKANNEDWHQLIYYLRKNNIDSIKREFDKIDFNRLIGSDKSRFYYLKGYFFEKVIENDSLSFINYNLAYNKAQEHKDSLTILYSLSKLSQTYDKEINKNYNKNYLNLLKEYSKKFNSNYFQIKYQFLEGNYYLFRDENLTSKNKYLNSLKSKFNNSQDSSIIPNIYNNLGSLYLENFQKPDSALFYYNKAVEFYKENPKIDIKNGLFTAILGQGNANFDLKNLKNALQYYKKADTITISNQSLLLKSVLKDNLAILNFDLKNYKNAYKYLDEYIIYTDSLNEMKHKLSIANFQTKYETEKKEKENIQLKANVDKEKRQKRNLWVSSLTLLLFGGITGFLIIKNSRRKQLLAEKNKEIEQQKVVTLLKEQELTSIDAMIAGQEKERKRIAEDLHDDLGSVLTTLKLHFENFKTNKDKKKFSENELIDKTEDLLDEAYNKVRGIAHAKNSGVIANQGLLLAIENMAEKISASKKIEIEVVDHGLENRLENSLELSIFRIVQELITNIVKHADAKHATIHLTNHDKTLNIMVEDDGKGFNVNKISKKGMGIHSIDKRIEHLDGTMTIESEIGKGTTVILDIPI